MQQQLKELQKQLAGLQQKLVAREGALSGLQATHSETLDRLASAQVHFSKIACTTLDVRCRPRGIISTNLCMLNLMLLSVAESE